MIPSAYAYEQLSSRSSFNTNLRHFKLVSSLVNSIEEGYNLADYINISKEVEIKNNQILPILKALIVERYQYKVLSVNLKENYDDISFLAENFQNWKRFDLLLVYHHPELGPTLINPKDSKQLPLIGGLKKFELVTIYFGFGPKNVKLLEDNKNIKALESAVSKFLELLDKKKVNATKAMQEPPVKMKKVSAPKTVTTSSTNKKRASTKSTTSKKKATPVVETVSVTPTVEVSNTKSSSSVSAPSPTAPPPQGSKMVGPYAVPVTNELFHNGNVEAWKRIIESYKVSHAGTDVVILYDGERIHDINTLFKWGKVKHGSAILFAVTGDNITDVSKLKKYLSQGASSRFEVFLNSPVGKVLNLF
ncbi:hypothetical protein [Spirochaeta cellobiosiphila]|uniref:hypothetical protein n=1 Tax=Spirochaeta cellobiosiphila TaxID=504483 RepID=UPI0004202BFD|nr:hypothetical protein [Spirochaeta cellobiosiphila]